MKIPTFKEQYDKIVTAYMKDRLTPMDPCACFVGNLLNGSKEWFDFGGHVATGGYTARELCRLETVFMGSGPFDPDGSVGTLHGKPYKGTTLPYEERLYNAMERTLLLLRSIHEERGEVIEDYNFTKRILV
jgi:hypothetical protein